LFVCLFVCLFVYNVAGPGNAKLPAPIRSILYAV
jgi:hypothetical protein